MAALRRSLVALALVDHQWARGAGTHVRRYADPCSQPLLPVRTCPVLAYGRRLGWAMQAGQANRVGGGLRSCAHSSDSAHAVATEDRPPLSLPTPHKGACLRVSAAASMRGLEPRGRGCVRRGVRRTPRRAAATPTQHIQPCPHHALALPVALLAVPHAMRRGASPPYTHSPQLAPPQICPRSPRACRRRTFSSFRR